mmetsp:Transcript_89867/g.253444  ORF Transcript_89867/g.253444 Transcript_89867/m.253444 type:complete len:225 (-) Transcript_89867:663-1337(-)
MERRLAGLGVAPSIAFVATLQPVCPHGSLAFDLHKAPLLENVTLVGEQSVRDQFAALDLACCARGLHAAGGVDRIPEQTISRHQGADDTCDDSAAVDAHTQTYRGIIAGGIRHHLNAVAHEDRKVGHGGSMMAVRLDETPDHHVCVADGLNLIDGKQGRTVVHHNVQAVQEVDHVDGIHFGRDRSEALDVGKEYGHALESLWRNWLPCPQKGCNLLGKHLVQER